jgi:hypothetical protein
MVQAGIVPITWMALLGEWQRDWARETLFRLSPICSSSMAAPRVWPMLGNCNFSSKKALTANLRSLETSQLILRRDLSNSVLHVEYEIAEAARAPLAALVGQLARFPKYLPSPAND